MPPRPSLFIFTGSTGMTGGFIAALREAKLLADRAEVTLVVPEDAGFDEGALHGVRLLRLPFAHPRPTLSSFATYPFRVVRAGWALRRAMRRAGCERLQVNDFMFMEGTVARALGFRSRMLTWVRIDPRRFGLPGRVWLWLGKKTSDRVIAVSRHIEEALPEGIEARVLYDAAVLTASSGDRSPAGATFLFPGNYTEGKGQDAAIKAFALVAADHPDARLRFLGGDLGLEKNRAYRASLEQLAEDSGFGSRVTFGGFVADLGPDYGTALAVLNLSHSESFSLICQEAGAHGVPVIATQSGGPAEIIEDGRTGFLVDVGDVDAVADRMNRLLDNPDLAAEMGQQARGLIAGRFGADAFRSSLIEMFGL